jgi:hypothetical protein
VTAEADGAGVLPRSAGGRAGKKRGDQVALGLGSLGGLGRVLYGWAGPVVPSWPVGQGFSPHVLKII